MHDSADYRAWLRPAAGLVGAGLIGFFCGSAAEFLVPSPLLSLLGRDIATVASTPASANQYHSALTTTVRRVGAVNPDQTARLGTHICILNATRRTHLAQEAARILRQDGWTVWRIGAVARKDLAVTRLFSNGEKSQLGLAIDQLLGVRASVEPMPEALKKQFLPRESIDFVVVLGEDFASALRVPISVGIKEDQ